MKLACVEFANKYLDSKQSEKILLDVRSPEETSQGVLCNSLQIPIIELEKRLTEIPKDSEVYIYCKVGGRAELAEIILRQHSYTKTYYASQCGYEELKDLIKSTEPN